MKILLLLFSFAITTLAADRPNILFVISDDIRWDALGCTGSPHVQSPNIDRLAAEGVNFRNTFCTTSLCSPSRASILSGLYAHSHSVTNNFTEFPDSMRTFPQILHDSGYATAYIGKYHMGEDNDSPRPGYDWFVTHKGQGKYFDTEFNLNGKKREVVPGYYTTVVTDMAMDWLTQTKEKESDKPWCLLLGHKAPHSFYFPEKKYEHAFDDVKVPYPASAFDLGDKPAWIKQRLNTWHGIYGPLFDWRKDFPDSSPEGVAAFEKMNRAYWGTILSVDDSMGRLYAWLKGAGQLDNTIIVFMGDNGLLSGEHGMVDKRTMHEASIRIPLIVRYPKLTNTAKDEQAQILTTDLAPSMLELAGAKIPVNLHGKSFVKLVQNGDPDWRTSWFYHYNYEKQFPFTPNVRGIRTDRWKYIHYPHGDGTPDKHMAELYDISADPMEDKNLIKDPIHKVTIEQLQTNLAKLMEATGLTPDTDKMPLDEGIGTELPDAKIR
jgi:arylsulfatase A-like enzyme